MPTRPGERRSKTRKQGMPFVTTIAFTMALSCSSGCETASGRRATTSNPSARATRAASGTDAGNSLTALRTSVAYRAAERLARAGKSADAKEALRWLLDRPNQTDAEREFLRRQIALLDTKPANPANSKTASRAPVPGSVAPASVDSNCGPRALVLAAKRLGIDADVESLTKAAKTDASGTSLQGIIDAARSIGLVAVGQQVDRDALRSLPTPAVAWVDGDHFVAVLAAGSDFFTGKSTATIHDPRENAPRKLALDELLARSGVVVVTLRRR